MLLSFIGFCENLIKLIVENQSSWHSFERAGLCETESLATLDAIQERAWAFKPKIRRAYTYWWWVRAFACYPTLVLMNPSVKENNRQLYISREFKAQRILPVEQQPPSILFLPSLPLHHHEYQSEQNNSLFYSSTSSIAALSCGLNLRSSWYFFVSARTMKTYTHKATDLRMIPMYNNRHPTIIKPCGD